ncbi:MAG TPA: VOC family protein [Xanthobacteraceae bacterium]|jgi:catechol 2,3-dioxygenase-like lactoylglutathione lyase family enzyme|nr:VOC family protein [Xanthobacteraceae bacterium]
MIKINRIAHATFETPDIEKTLAHYTDVVGLVVAQRDKNEAFLASKLGQLVLHLKKGAAANCTQLAFEVAPDASFKDMAAALKADGVASEERNDAIPGVGKTLSFLDPKGTRLDLFAERTYLGKHLPVSGVGPFKLGHVAFVVPDPKAITEFYCKVLGFRVSDWIEDFFSFLRCGPDHHTVNFVRGSAVKLHHYAFELKDMAHIQSACELLAQSKIPIIWGPGRHGAGHNVFTYHRNPDDQIVEFYTELDVMYDEALGYFEPRPWHDDQPQRPKVWKREDAGIHWGPPPTADFLRSREAH